MSSTVSNNLPTTEAPSEKRSIFRSKALQSYSGREQQSVSNTLATPRSLYLLWALLSLVVSFGVITWLKEIPVFTPAVAVSTHTHALQRDTAASTRILLLLPGDQLNRLRVGQNVVLKLHATPRRLMAKIYAVEPEVLSQQAAQERFDSGIRFQDAGKAQAVAWARLVSPASCAALLNHGGTAIDAWVQTDSEPVLSLFPLMGRDEQPAIESAGCSGLVHASHIRMGGFFERNPMRRLSCCTGRNPFKQIINKRNEGGLYV